MTRTAPPGAALGALGAAAGLATLAAAGLAVRPRPFPDFPQPSGPITEHVTLPDGLPAPVLRWLRSVYGERVPVVRSVVVTGRARINPFGAWMPARFRFTHDAGRGYRHYIEATWFGQPVLRVNERYLDGRSLIEIPVIGTDRGPRVDQAANIGMWAELAASAPSVLVTDPRVSWRPIDGSTAELVVPLGEASRDSLVVRFDPASGAMRSLEALRFRSSREDAKVLWVAASAPGPTLGEHRLPAVGTATWGDMGRPWARFTTEDLRLNVDVAEYLRARGI